MASVTVATVQDQDLVIDTAEIEILETPCEVLEVDGQRGLGRRQLHLTFREGTGPRWVSKE